MTTLDRRRRCAAAWDGEIVLGRTDAVHDACPLFNSIAAACAADHLPVVDTDQTLNLPDHGLRAPQLIGVNAPWDVALNQESDEEGPGGLGIAVALKQDTLHEAVLVDCAPCPVTDAIDGRADLIHIPQQTLLGFAVA